jgi:regulatory protein
MVSSFTSVDRKEPESEGGQDVSVQDALRRASSQLMRREYSYAELSRWLGQRGYSAVITSAVVDQLTQADLLSNERFARALARTRRDAGYGPRRIAAELRERGVEKAIIAQTLVLFKDDWAEVAARVYDKQLRNAVGRGAREAQRRAVAVLIARGFERAHWRALTRPDDEA